MASLQSIAELSWRQCFPDPSDETPVTFEEFLESSILEYCYQVQLMYWRDKREDGVSELPSHLLQEAKLAVVNNQVDLCSLKVFRSFSSDVWLAQVGEVGCDCKYVRHTLNASKLLCDTDSRGHEYRTYIPVGDKLKFPEGVHENPITIIYAGMGENIDTDIIVDEVIGNIVRMKMVEQYLGKSNPVDTTNNSNALV